MERERRAPAFQGLSKKGFSCSVDLKTNKQQQKPQKTKPMQVRVITRKLSMPKGVSCELKPKAKVPHNHITN